jgi:hypothetical protein
MLLINGHEGLVVESSAASASSSAQITLTVLLASWSTLIDNLAIGVNPFSPWIT